MAIDYIKLAATAARLIQQAGRTVTFVRPDQDAADANKPWNGPADTEANPANSADVKAVFVPPSGAADLGLSTLHVDMLATIKEIAIVEPGEFDLAMASEMVDNGSRKTIVFVETLRPADTTLLYFVGVKR